MFAAVVLVIFSVGYVAMARKKTTAGGFYSYISHGLGREIGMGTGFGPVLAYSVFEASLCGGFAYFLNIKLAQFGINIAWPMAGPGMVVLISILACFDVTDLHRRAGRRPDQRGRHPDHLRHRDVRARRPAARRAQPGERVQGLPGRARAGWPARSGIGLFFAFWSWVGFEMAPNYGEESRNPKKIVPRALYISVIGLGVFYTLTSWAPFAGYSSLHAATAQAQNNSAQYYLGPANAIAGHWVGSMHELPDHHRLVRLRDGVPQHDLAVLLLTRPRGAAAQAARPDPPKWKSPHIASITQSVIAALIMLGFAVFVGTGDPLHIAYLQVYGLMAIMGVIVILAVQALVSLSILIYFDREHPDEVHWWKTRLAPAISFIAQVFVIYLLFKNMLFLGSGYSLRGLARADRPAGHRCSGSAWRVLPEGPEPGEVRVCRAADQRRDSEHRQEQATGGGAGPATGPGAARPTAGRARRAGHGSHRPAAAGRIPVLRGTGRCRLAPHHRRSGRP